MFFMFFFLHSISKIGPKTKNLIRPWQVLSDAEYPEIMTGFSRRGFPWHGNGKKSIGNPSWFSSSGWLTTHGLLLGDENHLLIHLISQWQLYPESFSSSSHPFDLVCFCQFLGAQNFQTHPDHVQCVIDISLLVGGDWNHELKHDFPETVGNGKSSQLDDWSIIFQRDWSTTNHLYK